MSEYTDMVKRTAHEYIVNTVTWNESQRMDSTIDAARYVSKYLHRGQVDKVGVDYYKHPQTVAEYASEIFRAINFDMPEIDDRPIRVVALLHDVVEDTEFSVDDVRFVFGSVIADAVMRLTKREGQTHTEYLEGIIGNEWATVVKIADLMHNSDMTRFFKVGLTPKEKDVARCVKYMKDMKFLMGFIQR